MHHNFCTFEKVSFMTAIKIDKLVTERSKEEARYSATKEDVSAAKINLIK